MLLYVSDFLASRGKPTDFWNDSKDELALKLREFYCCVRKVPNKQGVADEYGKASYLNMRAGIQRFLVSPPHNRVIDIRKDIEFQAANQVLQGKLKMLRREGRDNTKHKSPISPDDLAKLYSSGTLNTDNPRNLHLKVFFEISLHFGRRGREGWRFLTKSSFAVQSDGCGRKYVTIVYQELDKNHQVEEGKRQMMFEQVGDPNCPVRSFQVYVEKLHPDLDAFLQRPTQITSRRETGM